MVQSIDLDLIREDVAQVLWDQYCKTIRYQYRYNQITVEMSFKEFVSLWSAYRINLIAKWVDKGPDYLQAKLTNRFRPVCGWVSADAMVKGGSMTVNKAKIMRASESRKMFQFTKGAKHTEKAKKLIGEAKKGKKQDPDHIAKRAAKSKATWAAKKAAKEAALASK